jgi:GntR family transcriptional repressor for pyruvate dehydrogenase complex
MALRQPLYQLGLTALTTRSVGVRPSSAPTGAGRSRPQRAAQPQPDAQESAFSPLAKTSVSLQAAEAIQALIIAGELTAGDPLPPERDLAAMLGISRPSVREATKVLAAMNLVEPRHGGGTYVTSLEPRLLIQPIRFLLKVEPGTFLDLFEVREVLEVGAAGIAAPKMTERLLAELRHVAKESGTQLADPTRFLELDFQLHTKVIEATENVVYLGLYESITDLLIESRRQTVGFQDVRRRAHEDHLAIVTALERRDGKAAADAMRDHLDAMRCALEGIVAREPRWSPTVTPLGGRSRLPVQVS